MPEWAVGQAVVLTVRRAQGSSVVEEALLRRSASMEHATQTQEDAVHTQKGESALASLRNLRCNLSMGGALATAELNLKSLSPCLQRPHIVTCHSRARESRWT